MVTIATLHNDLLSTAKEAGSDVPNVVFLIAHHHACSPLDTIAAVLELPTARNGGLAAWPEVSTAPVASSSAASLRAALSRPECLGCSPHPLQAPCWCAQPDQMRGRRRALRRATAPRPAVFRKGTCGYPCAAS
jgi:hypothetical protein